MFKKLTLLGIVATAMMIGGVSSVQVREKEDLDAKVIVRLKGGVSEKSNTNIIREQDAVISQIKSFITPDFEVTDRYSILVNAFSLKVNASHVDSIRSLPQVQSVDYDSLEMIKYTEDDLDIAKQELVNITTKVAENISATTMNVPEENNEGEGVLIAILDSGFLLDGQIYSGNTVMEEHVTHNAFTALDDDVMVHDTESSINAKIAASEGFHGKPDEEHSVYYNSKVPFFYDYGGQTQVKNTAGEEDYEVFQKDQDHGTHVASTAAGNDPLYKGIAPKAQLALMKVFTNYTPTAEDKKEGYSASSGAYDSAVLKALEDCAVLNADIVNLSLGSALTEITDNETVQKAISILQNRGMFINVAAGNEGTNNFANTSYEYWSIAMHETGILGSYAANETSMAVAAAQADKEYYESAFIIGENTISFRDQITNTESSQDYETERRITDLLETNPSGVFKWVRIGGWGAASDYKGVNAKGKIAICDRGEINFSEKIQAAEAAGAIALGVIDNDPTQTSFNFRMALSGYQPGIPVISILYRDRDYIDSVAGVVNEAKLVSDSIAINPTAKQITAFSSDGPTYDLRIKPEISAPGQSILGAVITSRDAYDYYDGTSMATPNYCGVVALMLSEHLDDEEYRASINDRLMSTANPMKDKYGVNFESVRRQGAGLVNVRNAFNSVSYLDGSTSDTLMRKAKIELGNSEKIKNGTVSLSFSAINEGDTDISYTATTYAYRPELVQLDAERENMDGEKIYELFANKKLQATYNKEIGRATQNVNIAKGQSVISLNDLVIDNDELAEIDENFIYGCYIEGYVILEAEGYETLSIPFLGFYGDIESADAVEPFEFERDNSIAYGSDVLNNVIHYAHSEEAYKKADYTSRWVVGNFEKMKNVEVEDYILNKAELTSFKDDNGKALSTVGVNPFTGEPTPKDIYVGNNGINNTMIISQFVNRSIETNTITIKNKANNKIVLVDHMYDALHGALEDEAENEIAWPLYKSNINPSWWSAGYIASRAYTIIPLYSLDEDGNNIGLFPDGEYEMKFSYTCKDGSLYVKEYTLHINSKTPIIQSTELLNIDGEDYYRIRYASSDLAAIYNNNNAAELQQDEEGYYFDVKVSDYATNFGFVRVGNFANAQVRSLVKFDDENLITLGNNSFTRQYSFNYTVNSVDTDEEKSNTYEFTLYRSGSKVSSMSGPFDISMKIPEGFDKDKLMVYEMKGSKATRVEVNIDGDFIFFSSNYLKFKLDASANNNPTAGYLASIQAYMNNRNFKVGDEFSLDNLVVVGTDIFGNANFIDGYEVEGTVDTSVAGAYTLTVKYNGLSVDLVVNVKEKGATTGYEDPIIPDTPLVPVSLVVSGEYKILYKVGDTLSTEGMTISIKYSDGSIENIDVSKATFSGYDMSKASEQTVTVSYGDLSTTYTITVSSSQFGCGGSIIATSALLSITALIGAGLLMIRKRKED